MSHQELYPGNDPHIFTGRDHVIQLVAQSEPVDFSECDTQVILGSIEVDHTGGILWGDIVVERGEGTYGCYATINFVSDRTAPANLALLHSKLGDNSKMGTDNPCLFLYNSGETLVCVIEASDTDESINTFTLRACRQTTDTSSRPTTFPYDVTNPDLVGDTVASFAPYVGTVINTLYTLQSDIKPFSFILPQRTSPPKQLPQSKEASSVRPSEHPELNVSPTYLPEHTALPTFEDLAGIDDIIGILARIKAELTDPYFTQLRANYDVPPLRTILLQGPGGVGKTTAVKALAKELRANYHLIKPTDITDMYVGNSPKNLAKVFDKAQAEAKKLARKTVLFFDEFDGIFSNNAGGNSGVSVQVIDQLKIILNNLSSEHPDVITVFATNETSGINVPLLRAGRMDEIIPFSMPNQFSRAQIFEKLLGKYPQHFEFVTLDQSLALILGATVIGNADQRIQSDEMAGLTDGMSGADIHAILERARRERMHQHRENGTEPPKTTAQDLRRHIKAHRLTRPNLD